MGDALTRRKLMKAGLLASGLACTGGIAAVLAKKYGLVPPDSGGLYGIGETLTYASQRILLSHQSLAREFSRSRVSSNFPGFGTVMPDYEPYFFSMVQGFSNWRLVIDGVVAKRLMLSLSDIKQLPSRTQVTEHICEEGWSAIAEWTGTQLSSVLNAAGTRPQAKYVLFACVDGHWGSLDMADALHPQTLLAYRMNGQDLPVAHGAPVRLRVERQLGYKSLKYIARIRVVDSLKGIGKGLGGSDPEAGYSWYAGI